MLSGCPKGGDLASGFTLPRIAQIVSYVVMWIIDFFLKHEVNYFVAGANA